MDKRGRNSIKIKELELELKLEEAKIRKLELEKSLALAKNPTQNISDSSVSINNINSHNNTTNNIEIKIVNFSDVTDFDNARIPVSDKECIKNIGKDELETIYNWYKLCFNNPENPEYQCIKKTDSENKYVIHGPDGWALKDFQSHIKAGILNLADNTCRRVKDLPVPRRKQNPVEQTYDAVIKNTSSNMPQIKKCLDDAIPEHQSDV